MKYYTSKVGRAIHDWQMIKDGDKIAVGLSGGKDSSLLLYLLAQLRRHAPVDFDLVGLHIDMGWNMDIAPIEEMCRDLGVELIVEKTLIGPIVFHHRKEKNPCSLCANMRRGASAPRPGGWVSARSPWPIIWMTPSRPSSSTCSIPGPPGVFSPSPF